MEVTQQLMQKNIYGKDIYQGIFLYTHKKGSRGFVIPMVTVYNKSNSIILQGFTYIDFTERTLLRGAYVQFHVYLPHVDNYDHHEIEVFFVEEQSIQNYETVVATQALFAKEVAEKRRTKNTAPDEAMELLNKYRRNLKPLMTQPLTNPASVENESASKEKKEINWDSPFTYGFKWGGFDKKENFLRY